MKLSELISEKELKKHGLTKNQFAQITGISHTYLNAIRDDKIKRPGRDKIITIGLGLNLKLDEINSLLLTNKDIEICEDDIEIFIEAANKRTIAGTQPLYDLINFDLLMISLESLDGDEIVVNNKLSRSLTPLDYVRLEAENSEVDNTIYPQLCVAFVKKRKELLDSLLSRNHKLELFICHNCFLEYIDSNQFDYDKKYKIEHLENTLTYLEKHQNYTINFTEQCPFLRFELKYIPGAKNKVFFIGTSAHDKISKHDRLYGFATDTQSVFNSLELEYKKIITHSIKYSELKDVSDEIKKGIIKLKKK
ncbi:hypothetical protein MHK_001183 [Candidatus Magnetomorum sp. HK-1]|nr:hypothetical protein MHK_001183 [Candidatus Magnetomorum sp. HK-1]